MLAMAKVLLTTSIIVDVPDDEDGSSPRMESVHERLVAAVAGAFEGDDSIKAVGTVAYDWLSHSATNAGKCAECERWVSNRELSNELRGLPSATVVDGNLLCDECRCFGRSPTADITASRCDRG